MSKEKKIDRLISEEFDKHYKDFKEYKKDVLEGINKGLKDIQKGNCRPLKNFCTEMEEKYHING